MFTLRVNLFGDRIFGINLDRLFAIFVNPVGVFVVILTLFGLKLNAKAEWWALLLKIILISINSLIVISF